MLSPSPKAQTRTKFHRPTYPVPLLFGLEWILMGVAILSWISPVGRGGGRFAQRIAESTFNTAIFPFGGLLIILILASLAWVIPIRRAPWKKVGYTLLGFGLCWVIAFIPRTLVTFSTLLLVVVMRACLYLRWSGRIVVAVLAFSAFVVRVGLNVMTFINRWESGAPIPRGLRGRGTEEMQAFILQASVGSILLFGLVLLFVLLMVGTLISEYQSRQKLALAHQRLRRFSLLVEDQATLQERNRIARELHDSIGHCLTAQSIQLENVSVWFQQNQQKAQTHLATARTLNKEALASVRQSVSHLRQAPVDGNTLPQRLTELLQDYRANTAIAVETQINLADQLPKDIAIALYRIIQESLTNITKHAQASQVQLTLTEHGDRVHLRIQDNGNGFTIATNQRGFGLTSMRERAEAINGTFQVNSARGEGCTIFVDIPRIGGQV